MSHGVNSSRLGCITYADDSFSSSSSKQEFKNGAINEFIGIKKKIYLSKLNIDKTHNMIFHSNKRMPTTLPDITMGTSRIKL